MRRLLLPACLALSLWPAALADAQVRIVVRPGAPQPGQPAPPPDAAAPDAVAPIEPTPEEAQRIAELIEQLGAPRLAQRDRAMAELAGYEARALRQVREAKEHDEDEISNRCALLEDVIQSRQAELFLAARRLSLQPSELERLLAAKDIKPLLEILKARAQPGLTPLWARVLAMLAPRAQAIAAAQLCISVEGASGYGMALAEAGRSATLDVMQAAGLVNLVQVLPPEQGQFTVEALAHCGMRIGGAQGVQAVLRAASVLRGLYPAPAALAALRTPEDPRRRLSPEGEGLRQAVALRLAPGGTQADLEGAGLPALQSMSPLVLAEYLALLRRANLPGRIENALVSLVTAGAPARALVTAGAAWADAVSVETMQSAFDALPGAAQIGALDALWLNPREPARMQPFLVVLLSHRDAALRNAAARMLGQYRAPSTVRALADCALNDPEAAQYALESLAPMADLLPSAAPGQLKKLIALLPTADLALRSALAQALVVSGDADAAGALVAAWKQHLPRNELMHACLLLAAKPEAPAGAAAAALLQAVEGGEARTRAFASLEYQFLVLMRVLVAAPEARGFELLAGLAADESSQTRGIAAAALAMAGKDGPHMEDWIRRLVGETPDPMPHMLTLAVGLSTSQAAEDFRRRVLQQGAASPHLHVVLAAVGARRSKGVTRDELLRVLFDTPANARQWLFAPQAIGGPMPPEATATLVTALLFSEELQPLSDPVSAMLLAQSGADVLRLLYTDEGTAKPQDAQRLLVTALMGEPARARKLIENAEVAQDGSNHQALQVARAWLGMVEPEQAGRVLRHAAEDSVIRLLVLRRQALQGDDSALRHLLDRLGPRAGRFAEGATAGVEISTDRWRGSEVDLEGVAGPALGLEFGARQVPAHLLGGFFNAALPEDWGTWWTSRRALLQLDPETGKYRILELP